MQRCNISKEDKDNIDKLREAVKDELTPYYDTDFNLLRWLQGHNSNFDIVIPKLKSHLVFRRSKWDLDHLADKPRNHPVHEYWKSGITGPAGRTPNIIVNVEQTGRNDYYGILHTFPVNEILAARLYDLETMLRLVMRMEEETGQQASIMYVMDLTDLKFDKHLLGLVTGSLSGITNFMSDHYVEMVHKFILVNAPPFIATIWTIAKPLLPERTRSKVDIFGSNWKTEIQNIADPEVLPTFWNDDDIKIFKAKLELSKALDPEKYFTGEMDPNCKTILVPPGKTGSIDVKATKQTPATSVVPMRDELKCSEDGIYKFWFSNEQAWFHTLNLQYLIDVIPENNQ
ncbi:unnamed protein product [Thelazia callipaeda]|uniref:CRAL-TRIO domain-containing protein n=1 Tax=Thelazia callipaeda TaxID=103827 RepID=A0A0N5CS88_THECL|nr:unnamed protein product [Thelazia callipaeda]